MKKVKRNSIIVFILTLVLLYILLKDNFPTTIKYLKTANLFILLGALILFAISYVFDALSYYFVVKQYKNDYTIKKAFRLNILTKFFNGITPLASGGQPLQLYELHKDEVKMHDASTIVIQFYIIYQIALVIISTICILLLVILKLFPVDSLIKHMLTFGYIVNLIILIILFMISLNRNLNKKVINFFIKILSKLHIIKDKEKWINKWSVSCDNFYNSAKLMLKNKWNFIRGVLLQMGQLVFLYSIPLLIALSIHENVSYNLIPIIVASSCVFLAGCFIPIPGATGGMEYAFAKFFKTIITKNSMKAVIILWRFITFFIPVIIGGIIFNIRTKNDPKELKDNM